MLKTSVNWVAAKMHRIFTLYFASLFLCAVLIAGIEGKTVADSLWYASVTSLTIGYGDITPLTQTGRLVAMIFAHFWVFGIAPLIITNMLSSTLEDRDKFSHEEQEEIKFLLKSIAQNQKNQ